MAFATSASIEVTNIPIKSLFVKMGNSSSLTYKRLLYGAQEFGSEYSLAKAGILH